MVVWLVANRVYPGKGFWDYAILGDDTVIADSALNESELLSMMSFFLRPLSNKTCIPMRYAH